MLFTAFVFYLFLEKRIMKPGFKKYLLVYKNKFGKEFSKEISAKSKEQVLMTFDMQYDGMIFISCEEI